VLAHILAAALLLLLAFFASGVWYLRAFFAEF